MANLNVVDMKNKKAGSVDLDPSVFEAEVRSDLFHAEVRRQLALRRSGTHSTKNRAAVSGGGTKPYRQKGTGRARQGTIRAPQWQGGGAVFGPVPRGYGHKLPKKVRAAALRSALSLRNSEEAIVVLDSLELDDFKTKSIVEVLSAVGAGEGSALIVIGDPNVKVEISARNLQKVSVVRAEGLNVYDVLRHDKLVMTQAALEAVASRLANEKGASE